METVESLTLWSLVNQRGTAVPFGTKGHAERALEEMLPYLREGWQIEEVAYDQSRTLTRREAA